MPENLNQSKDQTREITATRILNLQNVFFSNPLKDVYTASVPIAGCAWIDTDEGIVLIDTLENVVAAKKVRERITKKIKYIIYTHGHGDHIGGAEAFLDDKPQIIANKYLPDRFDKYKMLAAHRAHISTVQFNIPEVITPGNYIYPTKTFLGEMTFSLGGKTFELHTTRAETDDASWVYVPELKTAFIGDLMQGVFPNIGNPWKPNRFALDWAKALEEIRNKELDYIFCSGAGLIYRGKRVYKALDANIEVIRSLHDQVVEYINQGMHITEMIHEVKIPEHLKKSPYLRVRYSRPEFFVYNVYRWYHGYFDNNPAHLLPRPEKEVNSEIFSLIRESDKVINRARELFNEDQAQLGLQVLDVLIQAKPDNIEARKLRIELFKVLGSHDYCLMSRNAWVYFIEKDREFLRSRGAI